MVSTPKKQYVGTLVGESTSTEFRLALAQGAVREQDIIAVDAELDPEESALGSRWIRVWAKVQRIERINPLFPQEAGHELAVTGTNPFDTVLSLSREMVTAVCRVLGAEPLGGKFSGRLDHVRYPPQPASSAYAPETGDIARIVVGELQQHGKRALDVATLSNREDVDVHVDGHTVVTRHLAILAMTGAGKSWAARRLIEELAKKNYPMVIFDPHGDYSYMGEVTGFESKVKRYYAELPIFDQPVEEVITVVESLADRGLAATHVEYFHDFLEGTRSLLEKEVGSHQTRSKWMAEFLKNPKIATFGMRPNLFAVADLVEASIKAASIQDSNPEHQNQLIEWTDREKLRIKKAIAARLDGLPGRLRRAAKRIHDMEEINKKSAGNAEPIPSQRTDVVQYGQISIISLAGYAPEFQATLYGLVVDNIFSSRVSGTLKLPVLLILEEAHNFVPSHPQSEAEKQSTSLTKQIAQEGRKFNVGLVLISQRPSRLDETTLSQCNSYIVMRMVNPADQNFVRRVIESLGDEDARMLPDLDVGEALLSGQFINFPVLARMKPPESRGEREEPDAFEALEDMRKQLSAGQR